MSNIGQSIAAPTDSEHNEWSPHHLLHLFLGIHKTMRAPPLAWEFLGLRDLVHLSLVSCSVRGQLKRVEYTRCRDGQDYLVPFPGFPGLLSTQADLKVGAGLFQHQLASLEAMHRLEHNNGKAFGSLRGGILGDAPGLGKTITMLALIASTAGVRPVPPPEFWDQQGIQEGWKHLRTNPHSRASILACLKPIRTWVNARLASSYRKTRSSRQLEDFFQLQRYVEPPYSDDRFPTLRDFELYVKRSLKHFVPQSELELFRIEITKLQRGLDKRNRRLFHSDQMKRALEERNLLPSSATLVVVPDALLEHWFQQISKHLDLTRFADDMDNATGAGSTTTSTRGVVYLDGVGDLADARVPLGNVSLGGRVEPSWHLSKYLIVVTTFSRCEYECKREMQSHRMEDGDRRRNKRARVNDASGDPSPLLQIRWLRLVVDEGHELGTHEAANDVTRFVNKIAAERRWVLSGTPTTGNEDDVQFETKALDQLQRLLFFLRHPEYGTIPSETKRSKSPYVFDEEDYEDSLHQKKQAAKDKFELDIKRPFLEKTSREKLVQVLRDVMVLHKKEDIHLPRPVFEQIEVDVPIPAEKQLEFMEKSTSDPQMLDEYLHTPEFQSLVDQAQGKYIVEAIGKARQALMERGGSLEARGGLKPPSAVAEYDGANSTIDQRPIKAVVYSSQRKDLLSVAEFLYRELSSENIAEIMGGIGDINAELSRFRNGCKESKQCPVCHFWNDLGGNRNKADKCQQMLLEVVSTDDPQARFLIEPERICRPLLPGDRGGNVSPDRLEGEDISKYGTHAKFWKPGDVLEIDIRDTHPLLPARESCTAWEEWGSTVCRQKAHEDAYLGPDWFFGPLPQNTQGRMVVRLVKWQRCSRFHNHARWFSGPKLADAPIETIHEDVFILCLEEKFSHGLDLSFVTHIFLLEPIDDAALLEQVVSRAHRLGAEGPVKVETVNTLYKLDDATKGVLMSTNMYGSDNSTTAVKLGPAFIKGNQHLTTVVCHYCYRGFDSHEQAEKHEATNCPRNPENIHVVDPFHLSSVYREIRPPPPLGGSNDRNNFM